MVKDLLLCRPVLGSCYLHLQLVPHPTVFSMHASDFCYIPCSTRALARFGIKVALRSTDVETKDG